MALEIAPVGVAVAGAQAVIGKLKTCAGCTRREDLDLMASYAHEFREPLNRDAKPLIFFIPKPLFDGGYTQAQLNEIERAVACLGIELLPLEYYAH